MNGIEAWQGLGPRPSLPPVSDNPYQAPAVAEVAAESDAESTRRKYLNHEASVKGVGSLYLLGGVLGAIGLLALFVGVAFGGAMVGGQEVVVLLLFGGIGVMQIIAGLGLRKFTNTGRILGSVIAGISLIAFPIGTLIGAYILYLLLGAKGKVVFSPEYQAVIAQTPHIRYRTSKVVWILLGLVLLIIVFGLVALFINAPVAP